MEAGKSCYAPAATDCGYVFVSGSPFAAGELEPGPWEAADFDGIVEVGVLVEVSVAAVMEQRTWQVADGTRVGSARAWLLLPPPNS